MLEHEARKPLSRFDARGLVEQVGLNALCAVLLYATAGVAFLLLAGNAAMGGIAALVWIVALSILLAWIQRPGRQRGWFSVSMQVSFILVLGLVLAAGLGMV